MGEEMKKITNPLTSLEVTIPFWVGDWSEDNRLAWVYGIVCGWDDEAMDEVAYLHDWSKETVERLNLLHNRYKQLQREMKERWA